MSPLISAKQLYKELQKDKHNIRLVDASYVLQAGEKSPRDAYLEERIGNAVFFDIDEISDQQNPLPHMAPRPEQFAKQVGQMGISNDNKIVVYDQSGITMAASRVWWMFRLFGHKNVVVLNGGLPAWKAAGFICTATPPQLNQTISYHARFKPELYATMDNIDDAMKDESVTIIDARPTPRFFGEAPEPRANMNGGHIPTALNVPAFVLINPVTNELITKDQLQRVFGTLSISPESPIITMCGSGVTACVDALALHVLGFKKVAVYDGSWAEWGQKG